MNQNTCVFDYGTGSRIHCGDKTAHTLLSVKEVAKT
jgi:hypothetical protein